MKHVVNYCFYARKGGRSQPDSSLAIKLMIIVVVVLVSSSIPWQHHCTLVQKLIARERDSMDSYPAPRQLLVKIGIKYLVIHYHLSRYIILES